MGNATVTERVRVDVRLAAGPSARRAQGSECLSRAALLGAASMGHAQAVHLTAPTDLLRARSPLASRNTCRQRNPLLAPVSLPALPLPPLMASPDAPRPLEGRFAAGSRAQLGRLAAACEGALERQRERQEIEAAWDLDGDGQLDPGELLALKYSGGGDGGGGDGAERRGSELAAGQQAVGGQGGSRRRSSLLLMAYRADQAARQAELRAPAEVRQAFAFADVDGGGGLSARELGGALDRLGLNASDLSGNSLSLSPAEVTALLQRYDADEDGCLRLSEFASLVAGLREEQVNAEADAMGAGAAPTPAAPPLPPLPPYAPSMWSAHRKTLLLQSKQRTARSGGGGGGAGGGGGGRCGSGGGWGGGGGGGEAMHAAVLGVMRQRRTYRALRDAPVFLVLGLTLY